MRFVLSMVLALLLVVPAAAQQKRSPFAGDARLDKKVSVRWKKATLFQALGELKKLTGVALTPDRGVVDEPVMAAATEAPARDLLEQMAKLLRFTWARYGGTPEKPGYLLFKDKVAAQEEEDELNSGRRAVLQALQKEIDTYRRISRLSQDQLDKEVAQSDADLQRTFEGGLAGVTNNPGMVRKLQDGIAARTVASPTGRAMVEILNGLTPGQWDQVMDEEPVVFSSRPAQGELQLPAAIDDRLRQATPGFPYPKSLFRALGSEVEGAITKAEEMMQAEWSKGTGFKVSINLSLNMGAQPIGMLRVAPEPTGGTEGVGALFMMTGMNLVGAPTLFVEPKEDPAEREKRLAADPVYGKKATLKLPPLQPQPGFMAMLGQSHRVADILPAVEEAYGVRLVADAYNRLALSVVPPPSGEVPLYKILDEMTGMTRDWERDGDTIRLKSRTWAWDRRSEIPARYMQRWMAERKRKGVFTLDDLAEIASILRDEQVENLMYSALEAGAGEFTDFVMISANRDALRFWGTLLPLQRKNLLSGAVIPARSLFARQQTALVALSRPKRGQSMFAAMSGAKPARSLQHVAAALVSVEATSFDGPGGGEARRQGNAGVEQAFGQPSAFYVIRIAFPDGQKDEYRIPVMRPAPPGRPVVPAPSGPEPPAPPPPSVVAPR